VQLIAGYIDIILKTRKDAARIIEEEEPEMALEEHVRAPLSFSSTACGCGVWCACVRVCG
jgi:hypothetical protein